MLLHLYTICNLNIGNLNMENAKLMSELKSQERSIAWLGRQLNITRAYMHKMINGKRNFSEIYKKKCANALNIDYTDLFNNV